ncbi:MAG: protease complex subunit PrcB family protein [Pyrinomonadaceae bacterium]
MKDCNAKGISALLLLLISLGGVVNTRSFTRQERGWSSQGTIREAMSPPKNDNETETTVTNGQIKELAAGNRSSIFESFVAVARDEQTYAKLRASNSSLPETSADFFKSYAVVAAFLGQRRTSGYSVEITQGVDGRVHVREQTPRDPIVKMVLSAPFKIVSVPVETDKPIVLTLDATWQNRLRPYRVTAGNLTITGGFAGVIKRLRLEGTLGIMRADSLATFVFELQSVGDNQVRRLVDTATGLVEPSKRVTLERVDAFAIAGAIRSPFRAVGQFAENEQELTLNLQTNNSPNISDNFTATGVVKATAPPAPADHPVYEGK